MEHTVGPSLFWHLRKNQRFFIFQMYHQQIGQWRGVWSILVNLKVKIKKLR